MSEFKTTDLYEAAYLYACGVKLLSIEGGIQKTFVFESAKISEKLSRAYWTKEATINAKYFVDSIKAVKDYLFARGKVAIESD